jgi:hypothetical protein
VQKYSTDGAAVDHRQDVFAYIGCRKLNESYVLIRYSDERNGSNVERYRMPTAARLFSQQVKSRSVSQVLSSNVIRRRI